MIRTKQPFPYLFLIALLSFFCGNSFSNNLNRENLPANGIVQGPSIGFDSRIVVGHKRAYNQSPYGATILLLQPTTYRSQLRLVTGVPLFRSHMVDDQIKDNHPDMYISLDHEWGLEYFGISAGLSTLYMHGFDTSFHFQGDVNGRYTDIPDSVFKYPSSFLYNLVLAFRVGRPWAGFRARISWPLPYSIDVNKPQNLFVEYSAYGFFGNPGYKIGIGVNGFLKTWGHSFLQSEDNYDFYNEYHEDPPESREYQAVIPGAKGAFLIGQHNVVTLSVELGAIIFPRPGVYWDPELGLSYIFSFGKLRDPSSLDGKF